MFGFYPALIVEAAATTYIKAWQEMGGEVLGVIGRVGLRPRRTVQQEAGGQLSC